LTGDVLLRSHSRCVAEPCTAPRISRLAAARRSDNAASLLFALSEAQVSHFGNETETRLDLRRTFHHAVR